MTPGLYEDEMLEMGKKRQYSFGGGAADPVERAPTRRLQFAPTTPSGELTGGPTSGKRRRVGEEQSQENPAPRGRSRDAAIIEVVFSSEEDDIPLMEIQAARRANNQQRYVIETPTRRHEPFSPDKDSENDKLIPMLSAPAFVTTVAEASNPAAQQQTTAVSTAAQHSDRRPKKSAPVSHDEVAEAPTQPFITAGNGGRKRKSGSKKDAISASQLLSSLTSSDDITQSSDSRNAELRGLIDDMLNNRIRPVSWLRIEEAIEIQGALGREAYHKFLEGVIGHCDPVCFIFRGSNLKDWAYDNGKGGNDWIPLEDVKPYLRSCKLNIHINDVDWKGGACVSFLQDKLHDAPKLQRVEVGITYKEGEPIERSMQDTDGNDFCERGLKYHVSDLALTLWQFPVVKKVSFNNQEKPGHGLGRSWKWYVKSRGRDDWSDWSEEEQPR
ncbi:hypothetical protein FKW77_004269 [Venturia effusa]|uniref:Uncharacterized protein n=1 Tax=Venturia effusa TaxID=50376 RepID=A0A517L591_9PEZI|nr:hypothetical protein FKW77_004269 [Venturia effusa]